MTIDQSPNFERAVLTELSDLRTQQAVANTKLSTLIELVSDLQADLDGNGRRGIKDRLSIVETKVEERTGYSRTQALGVPAGFSALAVVLFEIIKRKVGMPE